MTSRDTEDAVDARGHQPGSPELRRLNVAMLAAGVAGFGTLYSTQALMPQISADFDVTPTVASLTVSAGTGALALAVLPMSALAETWGRDRVMRTSLVVATVVVLLSAAAPTFAVLVGLRALLGVAVAGIVGVAMGHLGAEVAPRAVGAAMGLYVAGNSLGGVGGRLVTSALVEPFGWRGAEAGVGVVAALATVVFVATLPEAREFTAARGRPGAVRDGLLGHLRDPALMRLVAVPFLLMGGFVATYNYLTYRLADAPFDLPGWAVGLVFLAYLAGTASSVVAGRLADRLGRPPVLLGSVVVMGAGLALTLPDQLVTVVLGLLVLTAGFFGAHATASGWVPRLAGGNPAQASALYVLAYYAGSGVVGSLTGLAWTSHAWDGVAVVVGALVLVALLIGATLRRR